MNEERVNELLAWAAKFSTECEPGSAVFPLVQLPMLVSGLVLEDPAIIFGALGFMREYWERYYSTDEMMRKKAVVACQSFTKIAVGEVPSDV